MDLKKKQKIEKVSKPYMKGSIVDRTTLPGAAKFFFALVAVAVVFLILGVMMNMENKFLAIAVNGVVVLSAYLIFHQTGAAAGADAVNQGEIMLAREQKGRPVETWEREQCYHPLKGFTAALIGSIPLLLVSVLLAFIAQPQVANLGLLPSWVSGLEARPEIGGALAYYHAEGSMSLESILRLIVRMTTMPYVNMIGAGSKEGMLWLERLSPVINLLPAVAYGLGYMMGVSIRTNVHTNIALGKKKMKHKQKKERRARQATRRGPEQLN